MLLQYALSSSNSDLRSRVKLKRHNNKDVCLTGYSMVTSRSIMKPG